MRLQLPATGALDVSSPCPLPTEDLEGFLAWHRRLHGDLRMEETDEERQAREAQEAKDKAEAKTFSQADLDRVSAQTRSQAERDAQTKFIASLGLDPATTKAEDIKAALDAKRADDDAKKDEATREKDAAAAEKLAAQREKDAAALERHALAVERALVAAGLRGEDVADIALLVKAERGADAATIKTAVEELKTKRPALFDAGSTEEMPHGDAGGASKNRNGGGSGKSGVAAGREEAIKRGWVKEKQSA